MKDDLIRMGDKTYKKAEVIPLSDNKASKNCLCLAPNGKLYTYDDLPEGETFTPQHLYIVDNSEIKEGDWIIYDNTDVYQFEKSNNSKSYDIVNTLKDKYKKIIATTDSSLKIERTIEFSSKSNAEFPIQLPRPSNDFLSAYVKANGIKEVLVEYEFSKTEDYLKFDRDKIPFKYKLKVAKDNTITIKPTVLSIEEAAKQWTIENFQSDKFYKAHLDTIMESSFLAGALFQANNPTKVYTKEEVEELFYNAPFDINLHYGENALQNYLKEKL